MALTYLPALRAATLLLAVSAAAAQPAAPAPMSPDEYQRAASRIDQRYTQALAACNQRTDDEKAYCRHHAKGEQAAAQLALEARYHPGGNNSYKAYAAQVELRYEQALRNCKQHQGKGDDKEAQASYERCAAAAQAERRGGLQDARQAAARQAAIATPPKSEAERKREADLDTAIRKCDSLLGDDNLRCMRALPAEARRRAAERIGNFYHPQ